MIGAGLAFSAVVWLAAAVVSSRDATPALAIPPTLAAGIGFLRREEPKEQGGWSSLGAIPSLLLPAAVAAAGGPSASVVAGLPVLACAALGSLLATVSLLTLGRSFGVFPARRTLVTNGVYSLVRHPAYLGECLLAGALCARAPTAPSLGVLALGLLATSLRVVVEERVLRRDPEWQRYRADVPWRVVPFIW